METNMSTTVQSGSATIYQFPARGRFAVNAQQTESNVAMLRAPKISFGSSWYHDEAIEAERTLKN
jgi:hypothetical protein